MINIKLIKNVYSFAGLIMKEKQNGNYLPEIWFLFSVVLLVFSV